MKLDCTKILKEIDGKNTLTKSGATATVGFACADALFHVTGDLDWNKKVEIAQIGKKLLECKAILDLTDLEWELISKCCAIRYPPYLILGIFESLSS